jgi:hypothetical protein
VLQLSEVECNRLSLDIIMIKNLVQNVWKTDKRVASMIEVDGLLVLGGFKGEIGILNKKTGKNTWHSQEIMNNQHLTNIQQLPRPKHQTFLIQSKMGYFFILELHTHDKTASWHLLTSIKTDLVTLTRFPVIETADNHWRCVTNRLDDSCALQTIEFRVEMDVWDVKNGNVQFQIPDDFDTEMVNMS